jgi:hypothetical protein
MPDVQAAKYKKLKEGGKIFIAACLAEGITEREAHGRLMGWALSRMREDGVADS